MTDAGWSSCTYPQKMLRFLQTKASQRKLRLFASGLCRRLSILNEEYADVLLNAAQIAEMYAEGEATKEELLAEHEAHIPWGGEESVMIGACDPDSYSGAWNSAVAAVDAAEVLARKSARRNRGGVRAKEARDREHLAQCALLREIFGNPFRSTALNPAWLTPAVTQLAAATYEERAFDHMPILGDALEEAGFSNADILNHCRQPGEHVRGCWVVDLILGKS